MTKKEMKIRSTCPYANNEGKGVGYVCKKGGRYASSICFGCKDMYKFVNH